MVAKVIARVFPAYSWFAERVIAEGIEPAGAFPSGPFPRDKLTFKSKRIVEFETPAGASGLGTDSWLQKSDEPIHGVAILFGEGPDLVQLFVRPTPETDDLVKAIIRPTEHEVSAYDIAKRTQH